ncbi:hypothetical protein ACMFMF_004229 [Clarireedia jacksonii]
MTTATPLPLNNETWIYNSDRFRLEGSTPTRRRPTCELPYSHSSPNIHNLVRENKSPVPFAPRSVLHKRLMHQRRSSRSSAVNFPRPLHSNPTVASSGLTVSVSGTDISQPRTRQRWGREFDSLSPRHNSVSEAEISVSRIPSPTFGSSSSTARRYVSTPVRMQMKLEHDDAIIRNSYSTIEEESTAPTFLPLHEVIRSTPLRQVSSQSSSSLQPTIITHHRKTSARPAKISLTFARVMEDDDRRSQRILTYLQEMCCTNAARKSFWNWQVDYARAMKNKMLLPHGGRMSDEKGWIGRVGRVISDGIGSGGTAGRGTGLGKRSAFGFRRARSGLDGP